LCEIFSEAITQRLWLKLPPRLARRILGTLDPENLEEIISLLESFDLLSHDGATPPCFAPDYPA